MYAESRYETVCAVRGIAWGTQRERGVKMYMGPPYESVCAGRGIAWGRQREKGVKMRLGTHPWPERGTNAKQHLLRAGAAGGQGRENSTLR